MPRSKTLTVLGTISAANQEAVAGAHVTVWGLQIILTTIPRPIKLGEGQTNADGRYEIITIELPEDMPRGMNVWIDVVTPQGATAVSDKVSVTEDRISIDL